MELSPAEIRRAMEWLMPLGVCCTEAQADGVPCAELGRDCVTCDHAESIRKLLLEIAARNPAADRH